jgi:L-threonylcarbamoyladenylate synthase
MAIQKVFSVNPAQPDLSVIEQAVSALHEQKIIIYPTDTTYAIAVNALDAIAIQKLFDLKDRPTDKPIHVVVDSLQTAEKFVIVNREAEILSQEFLPGPLTLVLPKRETVPGILVGGRKTLGIRIPDNQVCRILAQKSGIPFTTTSANISGGKTPYTVDEVMKQFLPQIEQIELIIDQGALAKKPPSTLVDLSANPPKILRAGPISNSDIFSALGMVIDQ